MDRAHCVSIFVTQDAGSILGLDEFYKCRKPGLEPGTFDVFTSRPDPLRHAKLANRIYNIFIRILF